MRQTTAWKDSLSQFFPILYDANYVLETVKCVRHIYLKMPQSYCLRQVMSMISLN